MSDAYQISWTEIVEILREVEEVHPFDTEISKGRGHKPHKMTGYKSKP